VALARALAIEPSVLLLDEPFGALDAKVRVELRRWLRRLHEQTGQTTLFVTHDQEEALELADRVVVMREGRVEQVGTPSEIYRDPASPYVFDFIGRANVLAGEVREGRFEARGLQFDAEGVRDGAARLYVRPHDLVLVDAADGIPAQVRAAHRLADRITLELAVAGQERTLELDQVDRADSRIAAIDEHVRLRALRYRVFPT
jgi:sulfate transport system ATP-binding protein